MVAAVPFRRSRLPAHRDVAHPTVSPCRNGRKCRTGPSPSSRTLLARSARCSRRSSRACAVRVNDVVRAAPTVARVYLALAPPPHGASGIVREFPLAAIERFGDPELVALGVECLHVARVPDAVETIARSVFVDEAMTRGDRPALEGAVASCWWCALRSARLRDVDPIAEAAAICRYVARVA
jgi:hypothetical protein